MKSATPFQQPFLGITFKDDDGHYTEWHVDVDGGMYRFVHGEVTSDNIDRSKDATELLKGILDSFKEQGFNVVRVFTYVGSAGPSHIYRGNTFFERMTKGFHVEPKYPSQLIKKNQ